MWDELPEAEEREPGPPGDEGPAAGQHTGVDASFPGGASLSDLLAVLGIGDDGERLSGLTSVVAPALRGVWRAWVPRVREVYGDAWSDLVTEAVRPAPRDTSATKYQFHYADAGYCPRRLAARPYVVRAADGKRAMILDTRLCLHMEAGYFGAVWMIDRRHEVGLFEQLWLNHRHVCLALLDAASGVAWADVDLPGPPVVPLGTHLDNLLQSGADWLWMSSLPVDEDCGTPTGIELARWGLLCFLPMFISLIELGLGRQPSIRAMHDCLCKWLISGEGDLEIAEGRMSSRLRYRVIERDGFRCVMCGATAAMGAVLQIDHILPVSRGGKTVLDNLQTLCDRCNRGKGASLSPDLRPKRGSGA